MDTKKFECSVHGDTGDADCAECWGRLGDLFTAMDERFEKEGKGSINIVADEATMEKLRR